MKNEMTIRTVIFDLGRVLVPFDFHRGYRLMSERCGLAPEEVRERIKNLNIVHDFESGLIDPVDFVARVTGDLGIKMSFDDFAEIWSYIFLPETLIPESLIEELKHRHRVVLLSNTNDIHYQMIERTYPILRLFDDKVLSYRVKAMKPDPKIYAAAIEAARCRPEECFFTDDVPEYVQAARRMGIDAVVFENADQIRRELTLRGCLV